MRRLSWIFGLGAMFLVSCAVEPVATDQPATSEDTEVLLASPAPAPFELDESSPAAFVESCSTACPGEACCQVSRNNWVCC